MLTFVVTTAIINFMFFVSGIDKLLHFEKVVNGLAKRLGDHLPIAVYQLLIVGAIVIELACPPVILYCAYRRSDRNNTLGFYASVALILITVMATLCYHFPPTTSSKYYPFMSNLSLLGGLGLMAAVFYRNALL